MNNTLRRILLITSAILLIVSLSGCDFLPGLREAILGKADDVTTQITKKVEDVTTQVKKTKDAVDKKVTEVQDAAKKVQEAIDALQKVTSGFEETITGTTTGTTTGTSTK